MSNPIVEIPLIANPQTFQITLAGVEYLMRLIYRDAPEAGWILDIEQVDGTPLIEGIPLVTSSDLLAQYAYLGIGGQLRVMTDGDFYTVPTFDNLGTGSHLYFQAS